MSSPVPSSSSSGSSAAPSPAGSAGPGDRPDGPPLADPGAPLLLDRRLGRQPQPLPAAVLPLRLPLTAQQRTSLRGLRRSACGQPLLLQLPRGAALAPGEWLGGEAVRVQVEAAPEPLLRVCSADPLALLQAAYHLGNRHVDLEIHPGELRLLQDPVLEALLHRRGLALEPLEAPFLPEAGAYGAGHHHPHSHDHA